MDPVRFRSILMWTQVRLRSTEIYGIYNVKIVSRACEALGRGGIESCTLVSNQNSLLVIHLVYITSMRAPRLVLLPPSGGNFPTPRPLIVKMGCRSECGRWVPLPFD